MAVNGSCKGVKPSAESFSAVRALSGSGRVTRMRCISGPAGEELAACLFTDSRPSFRADVHSVPNAAFALNPVRLAAIRGQNHPGETNPIRLDRRVPGNRRAAGAIECGQKRTLADQSRARCLMVDRRHHLTYPLIALPRLDADCPLPQGRWKFGNVHDLRGKMLKLQPLQARARKQRTFHHALLQTR